MAYNCPICGKSKAHNNHRKCSRKLQKMYAPGTELWAETEAERLGRKASVVVKPSRIHMGQGTKSGLFCRRTTGYD